MKYRIAAFFFLCFSNFAYPVCAQQASSTGRVVVLPINIQVPDNAKKLGAIKLGNNSTQVHCAYDDLVAQAKIKAAAMGGNIVKIRALVPPSFISTCYKIDADIFYASPLPEYDIKEEQAQGLITKLSDTANYALLYVYRLADTLTFQPGYKLHMNDSVICHVKSKSRSAVKIYQRGDVTFWAETEGKATIHFDIKPGRIYFIRCGTIMGSIRPIPYLEHVPYNTGIAEYQMLTKGRKDIDISYLNQVH